MRINPEQDSKGGGGGSDYCTPGRKLCAAVGLRRWTASTGTNMLTMGFVVLRDGEKNGDEGKVFMERFPLVERAAFRIARWAMASGQRGEFTTEDDDLQRIMANGPLIAVLREDTYNGKTRMEPDPDGWAAYTGAHDPAWDAMIRAGETEFDAIQERMASARTGGGASAGDYSNSSHPNAPGGEDIPF